MVAIGGSALPYVPAPRRAPRRMLMKEETTMRWSTPKFVEVCAGMEINGYFPSEL